MSGRDATLVRTAHHEAGHAVVAVALGLQLGPATIVSSDHYGGFVLAHAAEQITEEDAAFAGPLPLMPDAVRRKFEVATCFFLAGEIAADLHLESLRWAEKIGRAKDLAARLPEPVSRRQRATSGPLRVLSPADQAEVNRQALQPGASDQENVWDAATRFVGTRSSPSVAAAFVHYCEAVTRDLLARSWSDVERLAAALLMHRTLSGEAVRTIILDQTLPADRVSISELATP